ncbi:MAG: GGDEF domain-containing protein [Pseudomonadota bacterium]
MDVWLTASLLAWTATTFAIGAAFAVAWYKRPHAGDARALAIAFLTLSLGFGLFALAASSPSPLTFALVAIAVLVGHVVLLHGLALRPNGGRGSGRLFGAAPVVVALLAGLGNLALLAVLGLTPMGLAACLDLTLAVGFVAITFVSWRGPREHDRLAGVFAGLAAIALSVRLGLFSASLVHGARITQTPPLDHATASLVVGASGLILVGGMLWAAIKEDEASWLRARALYDPLTSLLKRPPFFIDAQTKINAAPEQPHVVALCDIDKLDNVNTVHGLPAGDAVLARIGRLIWQNLPRHASAGRFAGDEIVLFFPHATLETVEPVLKALAARVAAEPFAHEQRVTLSIGQAAYVLRERLDDALILADAGLQDVKTKGGNGVRTVRPGDFADPTALSAAGGRSVRRIDRKLAA